MGVANREATQHPHDPKQELTRLIAEMAPITSAAEQAGLVVGKTVTIMRGQCTVDMGEVKYQVGVPTEIEIVSFGGKVTGKLADGTLHILGSCVSTAAVAVAFATTISSAVQERGVTVGVKNCGKRFTYSRIRRIPSRRVCLAKEVGSGSGC